MTKVSLTHDTVSQEDINHLIGWLQGNPRLTQGEKVREFEAAFARKVRSRYAVFVNSGSSANLIMLYAMKIMGKLPNNTVALPSLCWATDLAPLIQFGIKPVLLDVAHSLTQDEFTLMALRNCDAFLCVSALGLVEDYKTIKEVCDKQGVILLEDACESMMSKAETGEFIGTLGLMGTYSFYFSHHISTIEGGMVVTDSEECYTVLKMLRSHGWSRDIDKTRANMLKTFFNVSDFNEQFTFYLPGFNVRGTDLQAVIGLEQIKKLDEIAEIRNRNFQHYQNRMDSINRFPLKERGFISNFGYPIHSQQRSKLAAHLKANGIECRPLISGSIAMHPVWKQFVGGDTDTNLADILTHTGMYLPNHTGMSLEDVEYVCKTVRNFNYAI